MKKIIFTISLVLLSLVIKAQFGLIAYTVNFSDSTYSVYQFNSPTNFYGNRLEYLWISKNQTKLYSSNITLDSLRSTVNNGNITGGLMWLDNNGRIKRSPIDSMTYNYNFLSNKPTIPVLNSTNIISALGYTPYNGTSNPLNFASKSSFSVTTTGTSGAATYNSSTGVFNIPIYSDNTVVPTAITSGSRNFNQAYQISSTRPCKISVSPQIACNLSLSGGQSGTVVLEISPNGSTGWIYSGQISSSNTGTLTIGLNTTQISGSQLTEDLPAGYYWRLTTNNITGTPTYTFNGGSYRIY